MENKPTVVTQITKKLKQPNLQKLQALNENQLTARINEAPLKIEKKRAKFQAQINLLNEKIKEYQNYKNADLEICKHLLNDKKKPVAVQQKKAA